MPSFQENQTASQAQVQSLAQAKSMHEAMMRSHERAAALQSQSLASPYQASPATAEQTTSSYPGAWMSPFGSMTSSTSKEAATPHDGWGNLMVGGLLVMIVLVLFAVFGGRRRRP